MAYQTRQRDPLLDSRMQAVLEKRGREAAGIALILTGIALVLLLVSYSPDDPSWWAATSRSKAAQAPGRACPAAPSSAYWYIRS